jgi:ABC-type amino acid transport system permease subunit
MDTKKMSMLQSKRGMGSVWGLVGLTMALGIAGIVIAVIVYVLATLGTTGTIAGNANATTAVNGAMNAILQIITWLPLIVVISISALVIALVVGAFAFVRMGRED